MKLIRLIKSTARHTTSRKDFIYHVHNVVKEAELKKIEMKAHPSIPPFYNQNEDCIRVAMLSAMHFFDGRCPMGLRDLRQYIHGNNKGMGTDVVRAAFTLLSLGLIVRVHASSTDRIPDESMALAEKFKLISKEPLSHAATGRYFHGFCAVIHALDPGHLYSNADSGSHAVIITGHADRHIMFHESMRPPGKRSLGKPNMLTRASLMDRAREAHDHHSLVIFGPRNREEYRAKVSKAVAMMRQERMRQS